MIIDRNSGTHKGETLDLCNRVLSVDNAIQFCAIAHKSGYLISQASSSDDDLYRRDHDGSILAINERSDPEDSEIDASLSHSRHLTEAEMEKYTFHTGILCGLHKSWEHKFGKIKQFVAHYDDVSLVTIMLDDSHFLLFGINATNRSKLDHLISQKVMRFLEKESISP
jgi:hypothetical protein